MRRHRDATFKPHQRSRWTWIRRNSHPKKYKHYRLDSRIQPWPRDLGFRFFWMDPREMGGRLTHVSSWCAYPRSLFKPVGHRYYCLACANTNLISGWHLGAVGELACVYHLSFLSLFYIINKSHPTADSNSLNSKWVCWIPPVEYFFLDHWRDFFRGRAVALDRVIQIFPLRQGDILADEHDSHAYCGWWEW